MMPEHIEYRVFPTTGETVAIFPEIPFNLDGDITTYMHVGQHSAADLEHLRSITRPAEVAETRDLADELRSIGYDVPATRPGIRR